MFTAEIKINGALVSLVYGHNAMSIGDDGNHLYEYEIHRLGKGDVQKGVITHDRMDGIEKLVQLILTKETKKDAKAKADLHPRQA